MLARRPEKLKSDEQKLLAKLNECCPEIPILYGLTQGFAAVFREEKSDALQNWINRITGNLRIPSDVDQHSELMSITIPK